MTAGAATPPLLRPFGLRVPIVPAKGYSLTLQGEGVAPRTALYLCEPKIGVSGYDGGVRIAGTFELPGRNLDVDRKRVGYILDDTLPFIRGWKPAPGEVEKEGWAGFRPATPDSLPLLGPIPGQDGLFVAAGHGMLGVTLAPATGVAIADMVTSGTRARVARADGARAAASRRCRASPSRLCGVASASARMSLIMCDSS